MNWLRKLPGYQRTPYGVEVRLLRMMPRGLLAGVVLPACMSALARLVFNQGTSAEIEHNLQTFDFVMVGLAVFIWIASLTVAIGCVIVWLMKGPAYVADGYNVSDSDKPKI